MSLRKILIIIFLIILSGLLSCSKADKEPATTMVTFNFSKLEKNKGVETWGQTLPTAYTEIDCYGILVRAPELPPLGGCFNTNGNLIFEADKPLGMFPRGGSFTAPIPNGPNREFYLVGFNSGTGACYNLESDIQAVETDLSPPLLLATAISNISSSENSVTLGASFTGATQIDYCNFQSFGTGNNNFDPCNNSSVPGTCLAWYDATDTTYLHDADTCTGGYSGGGGPIGCIVNKASPGTGDMTQATTGSQAVGTSIGGSSTNNSFGFDGADYYLTSLPLPLPSGPITVFIVLEPTDVTTAMSAFGAINGSDGLKIGTTATPGFGDFSVNGSIVVGAVTLSNTAPNLLVLTLDNGLSTAGNANAEIYPYQGAPEFHNGPTTAWTTAVSEGLMLGTYNDGGTAATSGWNGKIGEVLVYNSALSATARGTVVNYLLTKWGI